MTFVHLRDSDRNHQTRQAEDNVRSLGSGLRLACDQGLVVVGDSDGNVKVFRSARFSSSSKPLYTAHVHKGAVTSIVMRSDLGFAFTAGRDGYVYRHDVSSQSDTLEKSRVVCRVSGEVRCLALNTHSTDLFVAGDALRCISLGDKPAATSIPVPIAGPFIAVTISPCGTYVAVASASGDFSVVTVPSAAQVTTIGSQTQPPSDATPSTTPPQVKFVLKNVVAKRWRKDESAALKISWSTESNTASPPYLLSLPTDDGVRIFRLTPPSKPTDKPTFEVHATLSLEHFHDISAALLVPHTKSDFTVVCTGRQDHPHGDESSSSNKFIVLKVDAKKKRLQSWIGDYVCPTGVCDIAIDMVSSGNAAAWIATEDGQVGVFKAAVPAPRKPRTHDGAASDEEQPNLEPPAKKSLPSIGAPAPKEPEIQQMEEGDDDSDSASASSADADEDMHGVVGDLMRSKHHVLPEGSKRKAALRSADAEVKAAAMSQATRGGSRHVPSFLDDEAEENNETESGDDVGEYDEDDDRSDEDEDQASNVADNGLADEAYGTAPLASGNRSPQQATNGSTWFSPSRTDYCFQPGATPMRVFASSTSHQDNDGSSPVVQTRYLAYNSIGCIRESSTEGTYIQFHDVSRPAIKMLEKGDVVMAALGISGSAFLIQPLRSTGDDGDGESDIVPDAFGATRQSPYVYFRTYAALGAQPDWRVPVLPHESVRCIAVGLRYVAVATTVGLRIFSLSGLELAVVGFPARVVCMTGCNSTRLSQTLRYDQDPLAIAYHSSCGSPLEVVVLNCHNQTVIQAPIVLPLTFHASQTSADEDHYLVWMGYSDDGPLHTCDSHGTVRMLSGDWGASWIPVFEPLHFTSDPVYRYWVWAVNDQHMFAYKTSRGSDDPHPIAPLSGTAANTMEQIKLRMPLLRPTFGGEAFVVSRERFLRNVMKVNSLKRTSTHYTAQMAKHDAFHDQKLMEWFREALKEVQTSRAVDIGAMFQLRESVEEAARIANQEGHKNVVMKLLGIAEARHTMKLRRLCTLPAEGTDITEKERDQILRKLLLKEKQQQQQQQGSGTPSNVAGVVHMPSVIEKHVTLDNTTLCETEQSAEEENRQRKSASMESKQRRSIAFSESDVVSPKPAIAAPAAPSMHPLVLGATSAAATTLSAPSSVKPSPPTFGSSLLAAKSTATAVVKAAPPSFGKAPPQAASVPIPAVASNVLGLATATPVKKELSASRDSGDSSIETTGANAKPSPASSEAPKKNANDAQRTSSISKSSPVHRATASVKPTKTKHAPPQPAVTSPFDEPAPVFVDIPASGVAMEPFDPFLAPGEDGTRMGSGGVDLGHRPETMPSEGAAIEPKTFSFGDALRKRYREEEDDDNDDGGAPSGLRGLFGGH